MQQGGRGGLRASMPVVASIVDDLRRELGQEWADRIVAGGMKGNRSFYAYEVGPDGVLRDVGSSVDGARVQLVDGQPVMRAWPPAGAVPVGYWDLPGALGKSMRGGDGTDS